MKKLLKALVILIAAIVLLGAGFLGYLTLTEYKPEPTETVEVKGEAEDGEIAEGRLTLVSWNVGYCGLDSTASFVLDGGTGSGNVRDGGQLTDNVNAITACLGALDADVYMLQEVDMDSRRSMSTDETEFFRSHLPAYAASSRALESAFAMNYSCDFVPFPWPPIGKVNSGVETLSALDISEAERLALPCPFSWPLRVANLKRCLLVSRMALPDTDKGLVTVNLHLEAYDSGEGKAAQTAALMELIEEEYAKGNYVIAGGDFNQTFPGGLEAYPVQKEGIWAPGTLEESDLPEGFAFAYDVSNPSCRSLDRPLESDDPAFQYYLIDGFILSPNVILESVETVDMGFEHSDHNPVKLTVALEGLVPEVPEEPEAETRDFTINMEGTEETVTMTYTELAASNCPSLGLFIDTERFAVREFEGEYDILPVDAGGDPVGWMHLCAFTESADIKAEETLKSSGGYLSYNDEGMVKLGEYDAYCLSYRNASADDGDFGGTVYFIPCGGGTLCVDLRWIAEAAEGMWPRLRLMAESIVIK